MIDHAGASHYPFVVYSYGRVELQFQYMTAPPLDDIALRKEFLNRVNAAVGDSVPSDSLNRRPSIQLGLLANNPAALAGFVAALDWYRSIVLAGAATQ